MGPAGLGGWRAERGEQGWAFVAKMAPVPLHVLGHRPAGCSHTLPPPPLPRLQRDIFESVGFFPLTVEPVARRLVAEALSHSPTTHFYDGACLGPAHPPRPTPGRLLASHAVTQLGGRGRSCCQLLPCLPRPPAANPPAHQCHDPPPCPVQAAGSGTPG